MKKLNKKVILIVVAITLLIGIYYFFIKDSDYVENDIYLNTLYINKEEDNSKTEIIGDKEKIVIYIAGAIKHEGIYELDENSRIADCIEKAGGPTEDANIQNINLAYVLEDGVKVYIPSKNEVNKVEDETNMYVSKESGSQALSSDNVTKKSSKININTATQTDLETLPGIGPSTAVKIINYRKENGKFTCIDDIKNVSGIGDSKFLKIKEHITV